MFFPNTVCLTDVCLRDGLQNLKSIIPTDIKVELAKKIIDSGFKSLELGSFVSPKWIPQMADVKELFAQVKPYAKSAGTELNCIIPNLRGMEGAMEAGADAVSYVVSVSQAHNISNVNRSPEESFQQFREIKRIQPAGVKLGISLATAFGCPFGEEIGQAKLLRAVKIAIDSGADELSLADTIGSANPVLIEQMLEPVLKIVQPSMIKLHLHDTQGMAMANYLTALQMGIYRFDASVAGLGGCPYAPGATGNLASEDLNGMLQSMGIYTGIDQAKLVDAVRYTSSMIPACVNSSTWARVNKSSKN